MVDSLDSAQHDTKDVSSKEDHVASPIDIKSLPPSLSKRQQKRLAKRQKWLADKPARRAMEKEKRKKRKAAITDDSLEPTSKRKKRTVKMSESSCRVRVALDIAYDHLMNESEISKTCKQIQRCYASNRRAETPLQLYITNFANQSMEKLTKIGCANWDIHRDPRTCAECFRKEDIVYLTSESVNVLGKLDDTKVYVIGGLVDHNKHKGLCHARAEENGFEHARLPIDEHITMKSRKVLSIVHVFEILLNVALGMTWTKALLQCLPQRKLPPVLNQEDIRSKDVSIQEALDKDSLQ